MQKRFFPLLNRKVCLAVMVCSPFVSFSCLKSYQEEDIYGVWKGQQNGKEFIFTFERDKTCTLHFAEKGAEKADVLSGTFEMDFTKQPIPLTIRNMPQLDHALHTAVDFIGPDSIRVAYFAPNRRLRPIAFGTNGNMHLRRISEGVN